VHRHWLILIAALCAGCAQGPNAAVQVEQPKPISTDFKRLPLVLNGIRQFEVVVLYEGLPSEFWEPQIREQEASRTTTTRLHGYTFYDDRLALSDSDVGQFAALFSAERSFMRYRGSKACGDYHPDYCLEWKTGDATTRALVCLECGEVKIFSPQSELHCDLSPDSRERLAQLLSRYRKNRPSPASAA
jgi:hypothetical protein